MKHNTSRARAVEGSRRASALCVVVVVVACGGDDGAAPDGGGATVDAFTPGIDGRVPIDAGGDPPDGGGVDAGMSGSDGGGMMPSSALVGWAAMPGLGLETTTGGGDLAATVVTTLDDFVAAVSGTDPAVVRIDGAIEGDVDVGSNKTIEGAPDATFTGRLVLQGVENVILRNLTIVGYNCSDNPDCGSGVDAILIYDSTHHVWIDHCDISDGSDGNLDITRGSDFVTVSWTKFSYSGMRSGGHQYSNLVGGSDTEDVSVGRLNITWHHNWWADNVDQRMPRIRYGQNHLFNNLYTSTDNSYAVGLGVYADVLLENNVFIGVNDPINTTSFSNDESTLESRGNVYTGTTGTMDDFGSGVFTPPYPYTLDDAETVEAAVRAGAG